MDTQLLVEKLIKAISYRFREDEITPELHVSALKNGYYCCSVIRYNGNSKEIIYNVAADTLIFALQQINCQFLHNELHEYWEKQNLSEEGLI